MDPAATQYPPNYTFSDTFTKDEDESGFIDLFNMMKEQLDAAGFVVAGPHPERSSTSRTDPSGPKDLLASREGRLQPEPTGQDSPQGSALCCGPSSGCRSPQKDQRRNWSAFRLFH